MITCPHCHNENNQIEIGKTRAGSQRYRCKDCKRSYTPEPKQQGYPDDICQQAIRRYVDGMNLRRIARHLGVNHKSVSNWVKAHSAQLPDAPVPDKVNNAEMDELYIFIGAKKQNLSDDDGGPGNELHSGMGCRD